jgi:hypothetical protein
VKETNNDDDAAFDKLLVEDFEKSIHFLESHSTLDMTRDRFQRIFDAIEERTRAAEEHATNTRMEQELPMLSKSRVEMTNMYNALKSQGHLRLFGSIHRDNMPASGSHTVRPSLLEEITLLSMRSLTPKPSNTLLYAGVVVATVEGFLSIAQGWDINLMFFVSLIAALADRVFLNGAVSETVAKTLSPETQPKITRHEAGHFLCAYLLGCPVEVGFPKQIWPKPSHSYRRLILLRSSFRLLTSACFPKQYVSFRDMYSVHGLPCKTRGLETEASVQGHLSLTKICLTKLPKPRSRNQPLIDTRS